MSDKGKKGKEVNFNVQKKGPLIPEGVNQKSFYSIHVAPQGESKLKKGQVLKCTNGKVKVKNEGDKKGGQDVEKGDIIRINGPSVAVNEDSDEAAHFRVFTADK